MLILLSPAKTLDFSPSTLEQASQPAMLDQAEMLVRTMRNKSIKAIEGLMGISRDLAKLNQNRFREFAPPYDLEHGAKQALLAFKGDTYRDMELDAYTDEDFEEAQARVRILSGLYGVLRPLDLIRPYRLEMGSRLKTRRGDNLYRFWRDRIAKDLNATLEELGTRTTLHCASNEYFKAVDAKAFRGEVVQPVFKDYKNGEYRTISFFAKRARGALASWVVRERVRDLDGVRAWTGLGYEFQEDPSTDTELVFHRRQSD